MTTAELAQQLGGSPVSNQPTSNVGSSTTQTTTQPVPQNNQTPSQVASSLGGTPVSNVSSNQPSTNQPSFGQKALDLLSTFTGQKGLGQDIGQGIANVTQNNDLYNKAVQTYSDVTNNILKAIKSKQLSGGDITALQNALQQHIQQDAPKAEDFTGQPKSAEQYAGDIGQSALGFLGAGSLGTLGEGATLGAKLAQGAKLGAGFGGASSGLNAMQENKGLGDVATQTAIGAGLGAGLGVGGEALGAGIGKVASNISQYTNTEGLTGKLGNVYNDMLNLTGKQELSQDVAGKNAGQHMADLVSEGGNFPLKSKEGNLITNDAIKELKTKFIAPENQLVDSLVKSENKFIPTSSISSVDEVTGKTNFFPDIASQYTGSEQKIAQNKINNEMNSLISQNKGKIITMPNGDKSIPLDLINQWRKDFWGKSFSSQIAPKLDQIHAKVSFKLGSAMKDLIVSNSTDSTLIQDSLSRLGDHQNLLKILNARNGSPIGMSLIKRYVYKFSSGYLGNMVGGHGAGLVGYWSGDKLARMVENPNIDTLFIRKLLSMHPLENNKVMSTVMSELEKRDALFKANKYPMVVPQPIKGNINKAVTPNIINLGGENKTIYEAPAQKINRTNTYSESQKLLPSGNKNMISGKTINLPTSARETNLGLNEIKNAKINHSNYESFLDAVNNNPKGEVIYNPKSEAPNQSAMTPNATKPITGESMKQNITNNTNGNIPTLSNKTPLKSTKLSTVKKYK